MLIPKVREERSGWRDEALSLRHREWGWDCPALDVDFLLIEYDYGHPVALVEYKHEDAAPQVVTHPSYRALIELADRASLPLFVVRYAEGFAWFRVVPLNEQAKECLSDRITWSEKEYVSFLYGLRGRHIPSEIAESLSEGIA